MASTLHTETKKYILYSAYFSQRVERIGGLSCKFSSMNIALWIFNKASDGEGYGISFFSTSIST